MHCVIGNSIDKAGKSNVNFPPLVGRVEGGKNVASANELEPEVGQRPAVNGPVAQEDQKNDQGIDGPKKKANACRIDKAV